MNIIIVIQARNGSSRLPQKVSSKFFEEDTILDIIIKTLKKLELPVFVATTTSSLDDNLIKIAKKQDVLFYRGSEQNVLSRFTDIAKTHQPDFIVRVCADNPFIDLESLKNLITHLTNEVDYLSYQINEKPTILSHYGFWAEIVSSSALIKAQKLISDSKYLEHVTNFIYGNPEIFNCKFIPVEDVLPEDLRLTIDNPEDFVNAQEVYKNLILNKVKISIPNIVDYVKSHPELLTSMKIQKAKYSK